MQSKISLKTPFLLMMYGFPGAGKTAFSRQFSEELGVIHLQEDKIRHDLFGPGNTSPGAMKGARKIMDFMARDYLKAGLSVVYDTGVIRASERRKIRDMTREYKAKPILIWLQSDPESTYERSKKRDHRKVDDRYAFEYSEELYREILGHMQNPVAEDYIVVSAKHTYNTQKSAVIKRLFDLQIVSADDANSKIVKPGLTNLVPKASIQLRGDIIHRNISIR